MAGKDFRHRHHFQRQPVEDCPAAIVEVQVVAMIQLGNHAAVLRYLRSDLGLLHFGC